MNRPITARSLAYLAVTFMATGSLWSGVEGGGIAFGAICGTLVFAVVIGGSLLLARAAGPVPGTKVGP